MIATTYPGDIESIGLAFAGMLACVVAVVLAMVGGVVRLFYRGISPLKFLKASFWSSCIGLAAFALSALWIAVSEARSGSSGGLILERTITDWPLILIAVVLCGGIAMIERAVRAR